MDGTGFEIDIVVPSDSVESAAVKVARLSERLEASKSASERSAEAMRAGAAAYDAAEKTATKAAVAVEKIGLQIDNQKKKLAAAMNAGDEKAFWRAATALEKFNEAQRKAAAVSASANAAVVREAAELDKLTVASERAQGEHARLAKAMSESKAGQVAIAKSAPTGAVNEMSEAFGKLGGPLGIAGQRAFGVADAWKKMTRSMGSAGVYAAIAVGIVAIVAGLTAVAVAAAAATAKILLFSIGASDAAQSNRRLADGIARSVEGGKILNDKLDELATRVPQTREELSSMASSLAASGLRGQELADALDEAAVKAARLKWGPDFGRQLLTLDAQAKRFSANVAGIFGGLDTSKVESGLARLVALFDKDTASGRAMKTLFESVFQPLADNLGDVSVQVERYFLLFEIQALKLAIAIKPHASMILTAAKAFGVLALIIGGALALAVGVLVVGIGMMAVGFGALVAVVVAVVAGLVWLGAQIESVGQKVGTWLAGSFESAISFLRSISLAEIGANIVQGLADGIASGGAAVLASITGVADGAIVAAKKALGIASPSKVFAEIGGYTAEGMQQGVDAGADGVQSSFRSMVAPPTARSSSDAPASKSGHTFQITIQAGGGDAPSIAAAVRAVLLDVLEGDVMQIGGGVPA